MADISDKTSRKGLVGEASLLVTQADTAASLGSGLVSGFSTPTLVTLIETASVAAIREYMPPGQTSVGIEVNLKHLAPTPVGMRVRAKSELVEIEGRQLKFEVEAWDEREKIAEGIHKRALVDSVRFDQRLKAKAT